VDEDGVFKRGDVIPSALRYELIDFADYLVAMGREIPSSALELFEGFLSQISDKDEDVAHHLMLTRVVKSFEGHV
jgi:hypothetical protein